MVSGATRPEEQPMFTYAKRTAKAPMHATAKPGTLDLRLTLISNQLAPEGPPTA